MMHPWRMEAAGDPEARPERRRPWERAQAEFACDHAVTDLRCVTFSNGQRNYVRQCMRCGEQVGAYIKHSSLSDQQKATVLDFDEAKRDGWRERRQERFRQFRAEQSVVHEIEEGRALLAARDDFWERYDAYLGSDRWRDKRRRVLERDNHTCQACLVRKATQVHHLAYRHVFNEPLFDLVAICAVCHDAITRMDRGEDDE